MSTRLFFLSLAARFAGMIALLNPSLYASFKRELGWLTALISPDRPISPKMTVSAGSGLLVIDEITAMATAKSAAGSEIFKPPAMFK